MPSNGNKLRCCSEGYSEKIVNKDEVYSDFAQNEVFIEKIFLLEALKCN